MTEQITERIASSVRDIRGEDSQRLAEELRALRERQAPETTPLPPPSTTPIHRGSWAS